VEVYKERFSSYGSSETGRGVISIGDFNSMYPYCMLGNVPTEFSTREGKLGQKQILAYSQHWQGFIKARVEIPRDEYLPNLPYRPDKGKLIFPVGTFSGVWSSIELASIVEYGGKILDSTESVWFRGTPVFKSYVEKWYKFRDKTSPTWSKAMDTIAKLFLNSLYGKFGMNEEREKLWFFPEESIFSQHALQPMGDLSLGMYREEIEVAPNYVIPHIAAWITAAARMRLWREMYARKQRGEEIYYCDTDSIFTSGEVGDSKKLGELKLCGVAKRATFVSPKLYFVELDDGSKEVKAKGFGGFGSGKLTEEMFLSLLNKREKISLKKITKLREGIGSKGQFPRMKNVMKGASGIDTKRIHLGNGDTKPIEVNE